MQEVSLRKLFDSTFKRKFGQPFGVRPVRAVFFWPSGLLGRLQEDSLRKLFDSTVKRKFGQPFGVRPVRAVFFWHSGLLSRLQEEGNSGSLLGLDPLGRFSFGLLAF